MDAPLIIGPDTIDALRRLREKAAERPVDVPGVMETIKTAGGRDRHQARMNDLTIVIPGPWAFMVTFSIDVGQPVGTCRHMSMSIDRKGRMPNQHAVWMVAEILGFVGGIKSCSVWFENLDNDRIRALNLVQPLHLHVGQSDANPDSVGQEGPDRQTGASVARVV